jgi:hypothetical protein
LFKIILEIVEEVVMAEEEGEEVGADLVLYPKLFVE